MSAAVRVAFIPCACELRWEGVSIASDPRLVNAEREIVGGVVEEFRYSRDAVELLISTGRVLRIAARDIHLEWEVRDDRVLSIPSPGTQSLLLDWGPSEYSLQGTGQVRRVPWHVKAIAHARLGRTIERLDSRTRFFCYFEGAPILSFTVLRVLDDDGTMLYWNDCEW